MESVRSAFSEGLAGILSTSSYQSRQTNKPRIALGAKYAVFILPEVKEEGIVNS